jgi:hypothetical protein
MKGLALLLPVLVALQVGVQPALAWAWPVDGPVLRPFVLGDDPYAGGQHRGVDIGAPAGTPVRAPAAGTVSFAGTVPTGGKTITIRTADGYAATLQRLGSTSLSPGLAVREGDIVGSVGDGNEPYVYLGVRKADERNGYVDPLVLLPPLAPAPATDEQTPEEPDPTPSPAHGSGPRHHSHAAPTAAAVEEPSVEPARGTQVAPRASTSRRPSEVRRPPTEGVVTSPRNARAARLPDALGSSVSLRAATARRTAPAGETVVPAAGTALRTVGTAAASSVTQLRHTARPRCSCKELRRPQKTQTVWGLDRRMTSSFTEISSGSFSPSENRFRISMGMTILPRSSMWRMIPVFVAPLIERSFGGRAVVTFDPTVFLPFGCGGLTKHVPPLCHF